MAKRIPPDTRKEVIEAILTLVNDGKSLRQACKEVDFERKTFEAWLDSDHELFSQYERARENRADKIFDEILIIADTPVMGTKTTSKATGIEITEADMVEHRRLQVDVRKWMLGKMAPKKYGDKVHLEHSGEITTHAMIDPIKAEEAARRAEEAGEV